jgi:hypothetical protein
MTNFTRRLGQTNGHRIADAGAAQNYMAFQNW